MPRSAVVIGAGHNGLTAACYLARANVQVTVFEASEHIGGMTATLPLIPEAPEHLVSPCAIDAVYWQASGVGDELGLSRFGLRTVEHDPAWAWLGPNGESLVLRKDVEATIADIRRFSPADAETYRQFAATAQRALAIQDLYGARHPSAPGRRVLLKAIRELRDREVRRLLGAALSTSAADLISTTFTSEAVRGAFACMASILGSVIADSSGIGILATAPLHTYGVLRPIGGMQAIPDALHRCLTDAGGVVKVAAPVTTILVERGAAVGVVLADGTTVRADHVVCAIPPQVTARLLADSDLPGVESLRRAPANASGVGCLTMGLALRGQVAIPDHQAARHDSVDLREPTLFFGTLDEVESAEREARSGLTPANPPWTATILSARDPSQAPQGQDILYAYGPAPVRPHAGWQTARKSAEEALVGALSQALDGPETLEIGRFVETPEALEQRLGAPNGCIYHVDQSVTRIGPLRPALGWAGRTPRVPGLVLSGAGSHPGGGVSGLPGQIAAQTVLRTFKP
ncbi:FAD dependent oxidoreductase [Parafrankia sp. EAN1pec]|uniref:phytoene desaturase family protein n=1 Tax=Parafrankia sp. (strain EAN1pec) TaxID=298653 RepID=UPI0000543063|nr:FAD dependent oxidoreductase [Frankia sp. EAN1pec]